MKLRKNRRVKPAHRLLLASLLTALGLAQWSRPSWAGESLPIVPVKFNVLPGTHINAGGSVVPFAEQHAKSIIAAANGSLAGANAPYRLGFHALCENDDVGTGSGIGAGDFFGTDSLVIVGSRELKDPPLRGKGLKVWVCDYCESPSSGTLVLGITPYHPGEPTANNSEGAPVPVVVVATNTGYGPVAPDVVATPEEVGNTLTHESLHDFTCSYDIDGSSGPIDDEGHEPFDECNLLHPNRSARMQSKPDGKQAGITPAQHAKVKDGVRKLGLESSLAPELPSDRRSIWVDDADDVSPDSIDLFVGSIDSTEGGNEILLTTYIDGRFPTAGWHELEISYAFDTDNDTSTGVSVSSLAGADAIVTTRLSGAFPFSGAAGSMLTSIASSPFQLTPTPVLPSNAYVAHASGVACSEVDVFPPSTSVSLADVVVGVVPTSYLGALDEVVPYIAVAIEWSGGAPAASDEGEVGELDLRVDAAPDLALSVEIATPGESIVVSGGGFPGNSSITLSLEQQFLSIAPTDASGSFVAEVTIPDMREGDKFLYASNEAPNRPFAVLKVYDPKKGNVHTYPSTFDPDSAIDVLFVNGQTGASTSRTVTVSAAAPFAVDVTAPTGMTQAEFALYVWNGPALPSHRTVLPNSFGGTCKPTPLTPGRFPQPARIANNTGLPELGVENWPGPPTVAAPSTPLSVPALNKVGTFYFQGVIRDVHSLGGYAVTNGITVISQ